MLDIERPPVASLAYETKFQSSPDSYQVLGVQATLATLHYEYNSALSRGVPLQPIRKVPKHALIGYISLSNDFPDRLLIAKRSHKLTMPSIYYNHGAHPLSHYLLIFLVI